MFQSITRAAGVVFVLALGLGSTAQAAPPLLADEAQLITCTSDMAPTQEIRLIINPAGQAVGIRSYGGRFGTRSFSLAQVRQGVVLTSRSRSVPIIGTVTRDVVILRGDAGLTTSGGSLTLKLLREYGAFSNDYRLMNLEVRRDPAGWQAYLNERSRAPFRTMYFEGLREGDSDPQGTRYGTGGNGDPLGIKLVFASQDGRTGTLYNTAQLREE